jgi:lipid-binding SYLF domain-containing protein
MNIHHHSSRGTGPMTKNHPHGSNGTGSGNAPTNGLASPTSIIEQWTVDAKGAVEDAYANCVLGDDAGESARLVLVATPSDDLMMNTPNPNNSNITTTTTTKITTIHTQKNGDSTRGGGNHPRVTGSNTKQGNTSKNMNTYNCHQKVGSSPTNPYLASSQSNLLISSHNINNNLSSNNKYNKKQYATSFTSCGVTFCEVNGRAYVCALDESSSAYKAGVLPHDCVQYAAVLAKEWEEPLSGDFDAISQQALEREDKGQRISYEELKRVLLQGSGLFGYSNPNHPYPNTGYPSSIWMGPRPVRPVPTTIRIGKINPCGPITSTASTTTNTMNDYDVLDDDDDVLIYDPNSTTGRAGRTGPGGGGGVDGTRIHHNMMMTTTDPRPVVLVFRRTRQRPPRLWNVWPNYRLDDECDVACQILESLTNSHNGNRYTTGSTSSSSKKSSLSITKKKVVQSRSSTSPKHRTRIGRRRRQSSSDDHDTDDDDDDDNINDDDNDEEDDDNYSADDPFDNLLVDAAGKGEEDHDSHNNKNSDVDEDDDINVEASTIRGMIQKAVGLAFVRSNKVVFGVSVHGGSGIVIARLPDGTWSAPSCIGMVGMGLGLQVGLEVANYIFILQTKEALEHFQRGGSFTLGANVGAAFAGMGREAIGAASVSSALCGISSPVHVIKEDEYTYERDYSASYNNDNKSGKKNGFSSSASSGMESPIRKRNGAGSSIAPIVAYAKSEGLYVGVSLEGSRIFTRSELNAKSYKLSNYSQKVVTSFDILAGKILSRPPEAESLYALLHNIEFSHEIFSLPSLPRSPIVYNKDGKGDDWTKSWQASSAPIVRIDGAAEETEGGRHKSHKMHFHEDVEEFSTKFQNFLFGGVTVERIVPHNYGSNKQHHRQRRTIWVYAPQHGSLRFGFVSKLLSATAKTTNLNTSIIQDMPKNGTTGGRDAGSTVSEMDGDEVTLDSALIVSPVRISFVSVFLVPTTFVTLQ